MKKEYQIEVKPTFDSAVITRVYPSTSMWSKPVTELLEVSCQIDHETLQPKTHYKESAIDWNYRLLLYTGDPLANWQGQEQAERIIGADAIEDAKKQILRAIGKIPGLLRKGKKHPAYPAMLKEFKRIVKFYQTDFTYHDTLRLSEINPSDSFIWLIRESGTWLISSRNGFADYIISEQEKPHGEVMQGFHWTGKNLIPIVSVATLRNVYNTLPKSN